MAEGGIANFKEMSLSWPDQTDNSEVRCTLIAGDLKITYAQEEGFLGHGTGASECVAFTWAQLSVPMLTRADGGV